MPKVTREQIARMANLASDAGQREIADDLYEIVGRMGRTFGGSDGYDRDEPKSVAESRGHLRSLPIREGDESWNRSCLFPANSSM